MPMRSRRFWSHSSSFHAAREEKLGYVFVTLKSDWAADKAIALLDHSLMGGQRIRLKRQTYVLDYWKSRPEVLPIQPKQQLQQVETLQLRPTLQRSLSREETPPAAAAVAAPSDPLDPLEVDSDDESHQSIFSVD
ncbi:hypothetical protein PENTCL1PPCAC_22969 [Pristionchus entomophagus]|uniref:RRM domain-containing protein n=1 Tax=Pristionchus entomophagus TaxID=358040 RepID=A0AAV5U3J0_9BILA|nr:hypothetical protein PENTCL1PPCAC_22969 [Pristionchus entomophagus]